MSAVDSTNARRQHDPVPDTRLTDQIDPRDGAVANRVAVVRGRACRELRMDVSAELERLLVAENKVR